MVVVRNEDKHVRTLSRYFHSNASDIALDHCTFDGPSILPPSDQLGFTTQHALRGLGVVMIMNIIFSIIAPVQQKDVLACRVKSQGPQTPIRSHGRINKLVFAVCTLCTASSKGFNQGQREKVIPTNLKVMKTRHRKNSVQVPFKYLSSFKKAETRIVCESQILYVIKN